jgi:hypothetical protein
LLFEVSFNSRKYIPEDGTRTMPDMTKEELDALEKAQADKNSKDTKEE